MQTLKGKHINLRALEPEDLEFLFETENNESFWEVSNTHIPFSKFILKQYLENAHLDIFEAKQLRLIIEESKTKEAVGMIDLFDFEPFHKRAGIGVLVSKQLQGKGFASEAIELLINYAFKHLALHQLFANITTDNINSIALFQKHNFITCGTKEDWIFSNGIYKDEILLQLINQNK